MALVPLAESSENCADRQGAAASPTASRFPIEATGEEARVLFPQAEMTTPYCSVQHPPPVATFRSRGVRMKGIISGTSGRSFAVMGGGFRPKPITRVPAFG